MKLRKLTVRNFRNLVDITIPISDTTLLVGENNAGKTALLDALKAALPRTGFGRTTPFDEYDYHMSSPEHSSQTSEGIMVEMWFHEDRTDEWPKTLIQALTEVVQTDPYEDIDCIGLRITSCYNADKEQLELSREFLTFKGDPLPQKAQSPSIFNRFLEYVRVFYLSALRDSDAEFSSRSQFWGRILRDLKIGEEERKQLTVSLDALNTLLMKADPRVDQVRKSLESIQNVISTGGKTSIQPLPVKPWDLLSKSEVVIQSPGNTVDFPLNRHGQGVQSLAVLFLFQAYIEVLLKPTFQTDTEAILALEEPESHLHPQATRALTALLDNIKAQKIISTHSPYVIQGLSITDIRLFRRNGASSSIRYIPRYYSITLPSNPKLNDFCEHSKGKYHFHEGSQTLKVRDAVTEDECRKLMSIFSDDRTVHSPLRRFKEDSQFFLTDQELCDLDTFAKRIRGEVFFAKAWLLCEGQCEFTLIHYFAELLGKPLDQYGVTVIDFQNNGSPKAFVKLAQNLGIPWLMLCDDDNAGKQYENTVKELGFPPTELLTLVRRLPLQDADLETFLVNNGFDGDCITALQQIGKSPQSRKDSSNYKVEIANLMRNDKTQYINALVRLLRTSVANAQRVPIYFTTAIDDIIIKAR